MKKINFKILILALGSGLGGLLLMTVSVFATPPSAPLNIQCEGQINPIEITDQTPDLGAEFDDPDSPSSAHWDKVDDTEFDFDLTYIYTDSSTEKKDTYTLTDTAASGTINTVTVHARFEGCGKFYARLNGIEGSSPGSFCGFPWLNYNSTPLNHPGGSSWTWDDINDLQLVAGSWKSFGKQGRLSQIYVEVDHSNGTEILRPNGDVYTNIEGVFGGEGSWTIGEHWDKVDEEIENNDGSYTFVGSRTPDSRNLFHLTDTGLPGDTVINSVTVYTMASKYNDTENSYDTILRSGGNDFSSGGTTSIGSDSWTKIGVGWNNNPITGLPWTVADLDDLQAGMKVLTGIKITQLWMEVDYVGGSVNLKPNNIGSYTEFETQYQAFGGGADTATFYQCQVIADGGDWSNPLWNSGKTACNIAEGARMEIVYGGIPLSLDGKRYYQRWKFWDNNGEEGSWSSETDKWTMAIVVINQAPILDSCVDSSTVVDIGELIVFTGHWTDPGDTTRLLILKDNPLWASFNFETFGFNPKWLTLKHLDGTADDSFDVYVNGKKIWNYSDQTDIETWYTHHIPLNINGEETLTIKIQATGHRWSGFSTWGQTAIRHTWLRLDDGATPGEVDGNDTIIGEIDIGDDASETGHNLIGWGPIEPDTHPETWGNILGDLDTDRTCRTIWSSDLGCDYNIQTGCLAYSIPDSSSPTTATYITQANDGDIRWYARICDDENLCSNIKSGIFGVNGTTCQTHNVYNWAWAKDFGWNSFSCEDQTTPKSDYGVDINPGNGIFSGFSWSETAGRTDFNIGETGIPSENGLIAGYSINENGGSIIEDISLNNNHGTINGASWTAEGKYNSGLSFNESGYVEIPDSASLDNISSKITMEAWIKPSSPSDTSNWHTIVGKQLNGGYGGGYELFVDEDQNTVYFHVQTRWRIGSTIYCKHIEVHHSLSEMNQWYHIVGIYDKDVPSIQLYINGELKDDTPGYSDPNAFGKPIGATIKPLYIGGDPENNSAAPLEFKGLIDEVRIFNRVLSEEEIKAHYQSFANLNLETKEVSGWARACEKLDSSDYYQCGEASPVVSVMDKNGLVAGYYMDENIGGNIADESLENNNGVLNGGTNWADGRYNSALDFDGGASTYVEIPNSPSLNPTDAVSIELWIKPASVSSAADYRTVIGKEVQGGGDSGGYGILMNFDQTGIGFYFTKDTGDSWTLPNMAGGAFYSITPEKWYHIVGMYDKNQNLISFYVNGDLVAGPDTCDGSAIGTTTKSLYIGGDPENNSAGTKEFNGLIDEVRIYNRALTTDEVRSHYLGYSPDNSSIWNGWINLRGTTTTLDPYGVEINKSVTPHQFKGWAWKGEEKPTGDKDAEIDDWFLFNCQSCEEDPTCGSSYPSCSDPIHTDHKVLTSIIFNQAPSLSWTGEENYISDGLHPETGTSSTNFIYKILYTDSNDDPPNYVRVHIKKGGLEIAGSPFAMNYVSGDHITGAIYSYTATGLSTGNDYSYHFEAQDNLGENSAPTSEIMSSPNVTISNLAPSVATGTPEHPEGEHCDYCFNSTIFYWTYTDPESDAQTAYEIWIDDDSDFSDTLSVGKFNHLAISSSSCAYGLLLSHDDDSDWLNDLAWDTTYYWKVKVTDDLDDPTHWAWSDTNSFHTPLHHYPDINFIWNPTGPSAMEIVNLIDQTVFYDSNPAGRTWKWDFDISDGVDWSNPDAITQDTFTSYHVSGEHIVTLRAIDNEGYYCNISQPITIGLELPEWREASPF